MIGALAPILIDLGAPILGGILRQQVGGVAGEAGGKVIEALGEAFGTEPDAGQIKAAIEAEDFDRARGIVQSVEAERGPEWAAYLTAAVAERSELLAREDARGPFAWAWRPAMSWLLLGLWAWNAVLLPVVNAAGAGVAPIPWDQLVAFSGLWLAIYGGGHTLKRVLGR